MIEKISEVQTQAIVDSSIDQARLIEFSVASSKIFTADNNLNFPFVLFSEINRDGELKDESKYVLNIVDYAKERIAQDIDINRPINEEQVFAESLSNNVKLNVLRELIRYKPSASYQYSDIDNALSDILELSESLMHPVLFVANQELISVLNRSPFERELSKRYQISRQDGFSKEYICHIGQCTVYRLRFTDIDYSLLTSRKLFDKVKLKNLGGGRYVDVDFELNEGSTTIGNLKLKYWMEVDLAENTECIKLDLTSKET